MNFLHDYKKEIYDLDDINERAHTNPNGLISSSENTYREQIDKIANDILSGGYRIILMAGPSSSGKTTSSNLIRRRLLDRGFESIVISMDDFFKDRIDTPKLENGDYDFENVTALDLEYLNAFTNDLFEKRQVYLPKFNFKTGNREKKYKKIVLNPKTIIIIEGIHALNPIVFKSHQDDMYKIYICVNSDYNFGKNLVIPAQKVRLMRRIIRDFHHRGMTVETTTKMWQNVLAGENVYIKPYKNTANALINSSHAYEVLMYAEALIPLLKESDHELAKELLAMLNKCQKLSPALLPDDSLLNEFLN